MNAMAANDMHSESSVAAQSRTIMENSIMLTFLLIPRSELEQLFWIEL
jgi:hypothetical protein